MADRKNNIQDVTSTGLMGLSHFTTSRISMGMYEPAYLNLYTVAIQLPDAIKTLVGDADTNLLLESVINVDGLDTNVVPTAGTKQTFKMADRRFANAGPDKTTIDVKLDFEVNLRADEGKPDMFVVKTLRRWNDLIWDPLTGQMGLKEEYVAPQVVITLHDKAMRPYWQWTLYHVWPMANLNVPKLDFTSRNTIYKIQGYTLACDYWDEAML